MESLQSIDTTAAKSSQRHRASSFDCTPEQFEEMAFGRPLPAPLGKQYRLDTARTSTHTQHFTGTAPRVYAPLPVVPARAAVSFGSTQPAEETCAELASDRCEAMACEELPEGLLFRLLEHQQRWYDAMQQSLRTAEQLLFLCEHQQNLRIDQNACPATPSVTPPRAIPSNAS